MTLLNDLPEEVLHRVLSSVSPSHSQELALLSQLAGLSKRFSIVCRLLLYRIIASSGGQHAHLADVAKSPKLRKMVKQLSVALPFATDQSFVKQDNPQTKLVPYQVNSLSAASIASMHHLINLERLEIFFPQDQGRKPSITTEAWPTIDFIITPDVDSLLSLPFLSNLTYLSLSSPSNIVVHYAQLRALLKLTPRLETLSLAGPDPEHLLTVPMQSNIDLRRLIWRQARFTGEVSLPSLRKYSFGSLMSVLTKVRGCITSLWRIKFSTRNHRYRIPRYRLHRCRYARRWFTAAVQHYQLGPIAHAAASEFGRHCQHLSEYTAAFHNRRNC